MKALASIPIFVFILFVLPYCADSCCCPLGYALHSYGILDRCYCNFFGCNCGECPSCPPSDDAYCYYSWLGGKCQKSGVKACARFWSSSRVTMPDID